MRTFFFLFVAFAFLYSDYASAEGYTSAASGYPAEKKGNAVKTLDLYSKCQNYDNNLSAIAATVNYVCIDTDPPINDDFYITGIELGGDVFMYGLYEILRYDSNGKYLNHIGKRGQGPQEFIQLSDLYADYANKKVYALDSRRNRLLVYAFGGAFEKVIPLKFHKNFNGRGFGVINNNRIVFLQSFTSRFANNVLLSFMNFEGKEVKTFFSNYFPLDRKKLGLENSGADYSFFWKNNEKAYTLEYGNDTIFEVLTDTIVPVWHLTGGLKLSLVEHFKRNTGNKLQIIGAIQRPKMAVYESDNFIIFKLSSQFESYYKVYNKTTQQFHRTYHVHAEENRFGPKNMAFFIDDMVSGLKFKPQYQSSKGKAIAIIPAYEICEKRREILEFIKKNPTPEGQKLKPIIEKMTDDDNGLMMIVKFK